jgi:hypothetical protein
MSSVVPVQGNDTCHLRCRVPSVLKEGKMIDASVNCRMSNPPGQYCHKGQHLRDMLLDTSNTEVAKAPSQQRPSLLEALHPTMPTTTPVIPVVPLELSQVEQSTEIINVPCTVLDIQGNDTGPLRSSTASISKEGKKVVTDNNKLMFNSSLRCTLSLPTSDILAKPASAEATIVGCARPNNAHRPCRSFRQTASCRSCSSERRSSCQTLRHLEDTILEGRKGVRYNPSNLSTLSPPPTPPWQRCAPQCISTSVARHRCLRV